uniref:Uncharacterized protein n=1 Tax=Lutzomyia longipalpis TaxID=7200 RepID=A0A1B0GJY6_LUTLO
MATVRSPQKKNPKEMPQAGVPTRSESSDIIRHDPLEESQDDVQLMGVLNQTINIGRGRGVPVEANEKSLWRRNFFGG